MDLQNNNLNPLSFAHDVADYEKMFDIDITAKMKILECTAGPTAVAASGKWPNLTVISPSFTNQKQNVIAKMTDIIDSMETQIAKHQSCFTAAGQSLEQIAALKKQALQRFISDFSEVIAGDRYLPADLTKLSYVNNEFDLVLVNHWLFYQPQYNLDYHLQALHELGRIAPEIRIYPLIDSLSAQPSIFLGPIMQHFSEKGFGIEIKTTSYEIERGANAMLRVWQRECHVR